MSDAQPVSLLQSGYANLEWLQQNIEQLKLNHDQEFVAIKNSALDAHSFQIEKLMTEMHRAGIDSNSTLITRVSKIKEIL